MRARFWASAGVGSGKGRGRFRGSEWENTMRSSSTDGSWVITSESGGWGVILGENLGWAATERPKVTEASMEPKLSRARWVLLSAPPTEPCSAPGEPPQDQEPQFRDPPSSPPISP